MENNNKFLSKVLSLVTLATLFLALSVTWVLWGFLRTIDGISSNGVPNPTEFLFGFGSGNLGFGYGYGYGYGYGSEDDGEQTSFLSGPGGWSSTPSTSSSSGGGSGSSSSGWGWGGWSGSSSGIPITTPDTDDTDSTDDDTTTVDDQDDTPTTWATSKFTKRLYPNEKVADTCGKSIVNFDDIAGNTFEQYIIELEKISGLNGNGDGTNFAIGVPKSKSFEPNRGSTRSEYVKMILRSLCIDYSDMNSTLDDFSDGAVDSWQAKVVNKAVDLGWINANNDVFRVNDTISRAEALKIVMQAGIAESFVTPADSSFDDVSTLNWLAKYTEAALAYGIISPNAIYRPTDAVTRWESTKLIMRTIHGE